MFRARVPQAMPQSPLVLLSSNLPPTPAGGAPCTSPGTWWGVRGPQGELAAPQGDQQPSLQGLSPLFYQTPPTDPPSPCLFPSAFVSFPWSLRLHPGPCPARPWLPFADPLLPAGVSSSPTLLHPCHLYRHLPLSLHQHGVIGSRGQFVVVVFVIPIVVVVFMILIVAIIDQLLQALAGARWWPRL